MAHNLAKIRLRAAEVQRYRCYYCNLPIWERDPQSFCIKFRIGPGQAALLRSTAEHLVARRDGGLNHPANIVAACSYCNRSRHAVPAPKSATAYRKHVRARMVKGRWLAGLLALPPQLGESGSSALSARASAG